VATPCDKDFAIKRWVNWDIRVFELTWPNNPGPTRDPHDDPEATFTPITNGSTFTNVLSRGIGADCSEDASSAAGFQCRLLGDEHLFISEVRRLRADSPFNISRGRMIWTITSGDVPDLDFFGEDPGNDGDGCLNGVCNAEHNGPADDQFWIDSANPGGAITTRNKATIEFDANNNVFDGGVFTQNPLCTAPCDEDDFIGWGIVEVRLDPTLFFCTDTDLDGDCNPGEPGGDVFSPAYQALIDGVSDNTADFQIQFVDEFGEVCAVFTFKKRFVTSRVTVIKNFPGFDRRTIEGFPNIKAHTVQVGQTFSYTITAINDGEVQAQHVRITDTLPRFGDQFSGPPDLGNPTQRAGGMAFSYVSDRPAFDPQAIVYGVDEDNDDPNNDVDFCIIGRQAGNANAAAYVPPSLCPNFLTAGPPNIEAGTVEQARAAAISSAGEAIADQIVFIQYYDELILGRQAPGGAIESEDSVEITLRATPALYNVVGSPETNVPGTWCNIATVTDGPFNRGTLGVSAPVAQSFDADTLCHEVVQALLDIRKTTVDAVITAGDSARFIVELANFGSAALTNVVVHDTLDAALVLQGRKLQAGDIRLHATNCVGCTVTINSDSFTFSVTVPTLSPGGFREVYRLVVPSTTVPGLFCNRVTARATTPGGTLVETDIACITVLPGAVEFDVSNEDGFRDAGGVFQSAKEIFLVGDGNAAAPDALVYQVIVTNRSTVFTATNVRVVDQVAPNTGNIVCRSIVAGFPTVGTTVPAAPACNLTGFTWNIGTLLPLQSAEIQFRAEALLAGNDFNRVTLTADQISGSRVDEEPTTVIP
jgi:uncharacterized repeat protein (TIGR01451 family)